MRSTRYLLIPVLVVTSSAVSYAQVQLHGRVIDNLTMSPVANASVTIKTANGRKLGNQVTTDSGEFRFTVKEASAVTLMAEGTGYKRALSPVLHFDTYTEYKVEIRLDPRGMLLAPLEVVARSHDRGPTLSGFDGRKKQHTGGWYITRDELALAKESQVTDLVARAPGVWLQPSNGKRIVYTRRLDCPSQIYIDGLWVNRPSRAIGRGAAVTERFFAIDDAVQVGAVDGIEVYAGTAGVPAEFLTPEAKCGVVAIWTRRGN